MKAMTIVGTRPEAIKMAPVIAELRLHAPSVTVSVCATGQHRDMLANVLDLFGIEPSVNLDVMKDNQSLADLTVKLLASLNALLIADRPDWILVQGDTTSAMVGALAAYYNGIRIGHVEAGLRTGDKYQPFPEEINRRIIDVVADLYFAPTAHACERLHKEGVEARKIVLTGNTVIDALNVIAARPYDWQSGPLAELPPHERLILVTAHRRENFGEPLHNICTALLDLAARFPDVLVVFPVHPNPNVQSVVRKRLTRVANILLTEALDYTSLVHLLRRSNLVLSDSGGLQEEAPTFGVPVLVMRDRTERMEAIEAGTAQLVGTDTSRIVTYTARLLEDADAYQRMARAANPFGDGHASERIVKALMAY